VYAIIRYWKDIIVRYERNQRPSDLITDWNLKQIYIMVF
jgi:hypothetical protein